MKPKSLLLLFLLPVTSAIAGCSDTKNDAGSDSATASATGTAESTGSAGAGSRDTAADQATDGTDNASGATVTGSASSTIGSTDNTGTTSSSTTGSDVTSGTATTGAASCVDQVLASAVPTSGSGDTTRASDEFLPSCGFMGGNSNEVVYEYTAPEDGTYVFDTFGSAPDTILMALVDCGGEEIACNDDSGVLQSSLQLDLTAGQTLLIAVDGYEMAGLGPHTLNVDLAGELPSDSYGDCSAGAPCQAGEICFANIGSCGWTTCQDDTDCPPAPATGNAPPLCADFGGPLCVLDCSGGQTCPDGMSCDAFEQICAFA